MMSMNKITKSTLSIGRPKILSKFRLSIEHSHVRCRSQFRKPKCKKCSLHRLLFENTLKYRAGIIHFFTILKLDRIDV